MGSLWMLAASFFFALMAAFTKIGADAFGTFELVFYRQIFAVFVLGAIAFATPGRTLKTRYPGDTSSAAFSAQWRFLSGSGRSDVYRSAPQ